SRARQFTYTLPQGSASAGQLQFSVTTDYYSQVFEYNTAGSGGSSTAESNNTASTTTTVNLAPYADLEASNVTAPSFTIGDPAIVTVSWTVTNRGTGAGTATSWVDSVIASTDGNPAHGTTLAQFTHQGALAVGASYSRSETFLLPPGFTTHAHLFVRTDSGNAVFENGAESNNDAEAGNLFDVVPIPYADLVVSTVQVPATGGSSLPLPLSWTVTNQGIGVTNTSTWTDEVYLATDPAGAHTVLLLG